MAEQPPRKRSRPHDSAADEPPTPRTRRKVREAADAPATPPAPRRRKRAAMPEPAAVVVDAPVEEAPTTPEAVAVEASAAPVVTPPLIMPESQPAAEVPAAGPAGRRGRDHGSETRSNALGILIERRFADPASPVRSYSDLERRSGVSREALSRYVTAREDRRRSPTIETLAAIADALRISLEQVCRAAVAGAHGQLLPDVIEQRAREEVLMPLAGALSDSQFDALVELLRQLQRREPGG